MSAATVDNSTVEALAAFVDSRTEPDWLRAVRRAALERFGTMGWPTAQDEEFRRTDVSNYDFETWPFRVGGGEAAVVENPVGQSGSLLFEGVDVVRRSLAEGLAEKGVIVATIAEAAAGSLPSDVAEAVGAALLRGVANADNRLSLWHYATITHGAVIYVPRFVELADPFVVTMDERSDSVMRSPQIVALGGEGARFSVVERVRQQEEGEVLFNEGIDLVTGDAGEIRYFHMQTINLDSTYISNGLATATRDGTIKTYVAAFGGLLSKYRMDAEMLGPGGDAFLGGVYFPYEDQHIDMRTVQRHISPKAHSLTLYKGVITDEAHSVYQGLISVDHEALSTDAYLTNNNILLSEEARSDSIPTLQINTDEVRCSHGSTTGKLDSRHIYYLQTRGYSPDEAQHLLIEGFFEEVLSAYPETVSDEIHAFVRDRIGADGQAGDDEE